MQSSFTKTSSGRLKIQLVLWYSFLRYPLENSGEYIFMKLVCNILPPMNEFCYIFFQSYSDIEECHSWLNWDQFYLPNNNNSKGVSSQVRMVEIDFLPLMLGQGLYLEHPLIVHQLCGLQQRSYLRSIVPCLAPLKWPPKPTVGKTPSEKSRVILFLANSVVNFALSSIRLNPWSCICFINSNCRIFMR